MILIVSVSSDIGSEKELGFDLEMEYERFVCE